MNSNSHHTVKASFALFSRDERTHKLFRSSWLAAIRSIGGTAVSECRGFGTSALLSYVYRLYRQRSARRLIFGTSEVVLTIAFGRVGDVLVFTGLGRLLQAEGKIASMARLFLRLCYRGQTVISLNSDDQRYLSELFSRDVALINGEGYYFSDCSLSARPRKPLRIGYVGRLLKSKAVDRLIETIELLDGCRLTLIGDIDFGNSDGIDANWLQEQIANSDGKLEHIGFVDDVKAVLHDIDVVVSMSIREGLPFAVLDAIDSGCLALLSPVPGHKSFDGVDGIFFAQVENLPIQLKSIIDRPDEYFQYDQDGRKAVCKRQFGIEIITKAIANLLVKEPTADYGKFSGN